MDRKQRKKLYPRMRKIAVVIPSHNEPNIQQFVEEIDAQIDPTQIVVCNDRYGRGKGYALREALAEADADYYLFIDGDGDIQPDQIHNLLYWCERFDIVVGKKELPHRWDRKILTYLSRLWIKWLFGIIIDTQTGVKIFNYKPNWKTDGWAYDIEILYRAKLAKTMMETPVHATVSSGKSLRDILSTFIDTIKIRMSL